MNLPFASTLAAYPTTMEPRSKAMYPMAAAQPRSELQSESAQST